MILNSVQRSSAPKRLIRNGDAIKRSITNEATSGSNWSIKANSYIMNQTRFLTKVEGYFGASGQNLNILVSRCTGVVGIGFVVDTLLNGDNFTSSLVGLQEITLANPVLLDVGVRYVIGFRSPGGSAVNLGYKSGNTQTVFSDYTQDIMIRNTNNLIEPDDGLLGTGLADFWTINLTTEAVTEGP